MSSTDPAQSYLSRPQSGLDAVFQPKSIAVIGATERPGSVGRTTLQNLIDSNLDKNFEIYPVNPNRPTVLGLTAYPCVTKIAGSLDLAVIITPANTVPQTVETCGKKGVGAVIIISAGFKEMGEEGLALEKAVLAIARQYNIRVVGPNCLGVMQPNYGMNATFASTMAHKGSVAFASQSGAMCTAVLDWSMKESIGFSSFVSIGSMADVNWGDIIDYLGSDPQTHCILIYMETIGDARGFLSAAKEVAADKPIIVIKAGKSAEAAKAAASHTGSLAGAHDAFLAAMRRVGVMTVDTIGELFNCALALGKMERPKGPNLLIITNAGGPGVLATDAVVLAGGKVAELPHHCMEKLNALLPPPWSHGNPVDVLGDAGPSLYAKTLELTLEDPCFDGALVILSPQSVTKPTETAKEVLAALEKIKAKHNGKLSKPVLASWMGGKDVAEGFDVLNRGGIPTYSHPDDAAKTFASIWKNARDLEMSMETPYVQAPPYVPQGARAAVERLLVGARDEGRLLLTEAESKEVLRAFGIPVAETLVCSTEDVAAAAGKRVGFPCVVKLNSETITHKSSVGGVKLSINSADEIREAWKQIKASVDQIGPEHFQGVSVQPMLAIDKGIELILGCVTDPQFGQLVAFGTGGCMVEIFKDSSLSIPPLNATLARRQIEDTKIYHALTGDHGQRFPCVQLDELDKMLVLFSHMVVELSELVEEIDVNPLLALPDRFIALDARFLLRNKTDPLPHLAIRPYPRQHILRNIQLRNGLKVTIRPTHPGDFCRFIAFHKTLSAQTIRQRYLREVTLEDRLAQAKVYSVCVANYDRLLALIAVEEREGAEQSDEDSEESDMYAICRLTRWPTRHEVAEIRMAVRDDVQGQGLGTAVLEHAMKVAKADGIVELRASVLDENTGCIKLLKRFGFQCEISDTDKSIYNCVYGPA